MRIVKPLLLFTAGGCGYMGLELLWRGWSHGSMFLAGGCCFLLLGRLRSAEPRLPLPLRAVTGAGIITMVELAAGLIANRGYTVWDYRNQPFNFCGQICLLYSLLWIPVGLGAMGLYGLLDRQLSRLQRPCTGFD